MKFKEGESKEMSSNQPANVRVTMVNHHEMTIARPPEVVWQNILDTYLTGEKFSGSGHKLTPLTDDLAASLGGYRMVLTDGDGKVVDDRLVRITENDATARRLSLCADYLSPEANGMIVHASYQAVPDPGGARYLLNSYSMLHLPVEPDDTPASVGAKIGALQSQAGEHLDAYLGSVKKSLEETPPDQH